VISITATNLIAWHEDDDRRGMSPGRESKPGWSHPATNTRDKIMNHANNEPAIRGLTDAELETVSGGASVGSVITQVAKVASDVGQFIGAAIVYGACSLDLALKN